MESFFFNEQQEQNVPLHKQIIGSQENGQIYVEKTLTLSVEKPIRKWLSSGGWLLLLAGDDVISRLGVKDRQFNYAVRFGGESTIVYVRQCGFQILHNLLKTGHILGGKALEGYSNGLARLFGFFVYHLDSNDPWPYIRIGKPIAPLRLEDLPEHLQDAVSWNWFDRLQFSESNTIQPIEHMPCRTWHDDKWWVDTQGQEHYEHPKNYF